MSPKGPPPPQPPASADCQTTTQFAGGGTPQQSASRMVRAGDGKMRIDTGNTSVITDPKVQQVILLDHVSKEACIMPMQPAPPNPAMPQLAAAAPSFRPPPMQVQDLGKGVIDGHHVDGKRYIVQPPAAPQLPQAPRMPQAPAMPGIPQLPEKPQAPPPPPMPTTVDVWTSTKLGLPVMTQVTGAFGQQTCCCKAAPTGEPHPSLFQIPPGYKPVMPATAISPAN